MRTFKCPICGSSNEENAKTCAVCLVNFSQLPEDLQLQIQHELENQQEAVPLQEDEKNDRQNEVPDWLRKRIRPQSDEKENKSFDNYLDLIFHKSVEENQSSADLNEKSEGDSFPFTQEDFEALEIKEDGVPQETELSPEIEESLSDFSSVRPAQKWDETSSDNEIVDGKKIVPSDSENEFVDFSKSRPAKKWEDLTPVPNEKIGISGKRETTHPESFESAKFVSEQKRDKTPLADQKNENIKINSLPEESFVDFSVVRPQQKWDSGQESDVPSVFSVDESSHDVFRDEQLTFFENKSPEPQDANSELTEEEALYADFSVNRPEKKWDDGNELNSPTADSSSSLETTETVSNKQPFSVTENENSAGKNAVSEEAGLVDSFLRQIAAGTETPQEPVQESAAMTSPEWVTPPEPSPQSSSGTDEELEFLMENPAPSAAEVREEAVTGQNQEEPSVSESVPEEPEPPVSSEGWTQDEIVPDELEFEEDDLDEVPWNLFETGEMSLPGLEPAEIAYKPFSKSSIQEGKNNQDYQQRMVMTILDKIFQIEGLNKPFVKNQNRGTRKNTQFLIGLIMILGILAILFTGITDSIPLNPPNPESFPNLVTFNREVDKLTNNDHVLVVVDYIPGFENEMNEPVTALLKNITDKKARISLVTTNLSSAAVTAKLKAEIDPTGIEDIGYRTGGVLAIQSVLQNDLSPYTTVYLVSSGFESARTWLQQIASMSVPLPVNVIASTQLESLLQPYYESKLINSYLTGKMEKEIFSGFTFDDPIRNRRLFALWFLIFTLILAFLAGNVQRTPYHTIIVEEKPKSRPPKPSTSDKTENKIDKGIKNDIAF